MNTSMTRKAAVVLCVSMMLALVALPLRVLCQDPVKSPVEASKPVFGDQKAEKPERHPSITVAIKQLERVKSSLEMVSADLKGHRAEAIKHIDTAILELKIAIETDTKAAR